MAAPTPPPAPYSVTRTITTTVYTATNGWPPFYMVTEGGNQLLHGSAVAVSMDMRDRLHPPVKPK